MVEVIDSTGEVDLMVREELAMVLEARRKSVRVIVVVMVMGKVMTRVIAWYSPQQDRKEETVQFYNDVSEEIRQVGSDEFVMLVGDLNGHVGIGAEMNMKVRMEEMYTEYRMRKGVGCWSWWMHNSIVVGNTYWP